MAEIYVSTDIETDGPIPGQHSMLSLGCAAFLSDKTLLDTFSANLETLPRASPHPRTMEWWADHPEAWTECRRDLQPPRKAMSAFATWLDGLGRQPVFVAYPASFDFMFVYWYLMTFVGYSPFGHSALDIRSYAMAVLRTEWHSSSKQYMPRHWFGSAPHTHRALDDALEQGQLFCSILAEQLRGARLEREICAPPSEEDEYERLIHQAPWFTDYPVGWGGEVGS